MRVKKKLKDFVFALLNICFSLVKMIIKSKERSDELRSEGNKFYGERKFFDALLKYNESLCYSPQESESTGFAYANKSAVYFEMKLFDRCLKNIAMAKKNKYPEGSFDILSKRQEKCREMLKMTKEKYADPWAFFKISYPPNRNVPYIAGSLKVEFNEKYGRFVTAKEHLKVGTIVAIEKPFCRFVISFLNFMEFRVAVSDLSSNSSIFLNHQLKLHVNCDQNMC